MPLLHHFCALSFSPCPLWLLFLLLIKKYRLWREGEGVKVFESPPLSISVSCLQIQITMRWASLLACQVKVVYSDFPWLLGKQSSIVRVKTTSSEVTPGHQASDRQPFKGYLTQWNHKALFFNESGWKWQPFLMVGMQGSIESQLQNRNPLWGLQACRKGLEILIQGKLVVPRLYISATCYFLNEWKYDFFCRSIWAARILSGTTGWTCCSRA